MRAATVQSCATAARPASGSASARTVSAARARSGVIHTTRGPAVAGGATAADRAIAPNQAASVLPVPVGACTSPLSPAAAARQTSS